MLDTVGVAISDVVVAEGVAVSVATLDDDVVAEGVAVLVSVLDDFNHQKRVHSRKL